MVKTTALALAVLLATAGGAPGEVRVSTDGVRVQSLGQPLSEVLTQLSRAASFEVKYEGPAPSVKVYANIESRSVSESVGRLLEGTGVTWAARFDATGTKIELLIVGGLAQPSTAPGAGGRPSPSRPVPVEAPADPPEEVYEPPPMMEPQPEPDPQPLPQPPPSPQSSSPFSGGTTGSSAWSPSIAQPPMSFGAPVNSGIGWSQPGTSAAPSMPQQPQAPTGASLPQ